MEIYARPGTMDADIVREMQKDPYHSWSLVKEGDFVVDCGANIGAFSYLLLQHQSDVRIICIEPVPSNVSCLKQNLQGYRQCRVVEAALMGRSGTIEMYDFGPDASACHSVIAMDVKGRAAISVPAVTLDDIMRSERRERIDFLKLDVQGAEYDIFHEIPTETVAKVRHLAMELHESIAKTGQVLGYVPGFLRKTYGLTGRLHKTHILVSGVPGKDSVLIWKNRREATCAERIKHYGAMLQMPFWIFLKTLKYELKRILRRS